MHGFEFAALLAVEQLALITDDSERGNAFAQRNPEALSDINVFVHVANVDVDEHEVRIEDWAILGVVEVDVEDMAVPAPVPAKVDEDALVGGGGGLQGGSEIGLRLGRIGIDVARCAKAQVRGEQKCDSENEVFQRFHRLTISSLLQVCHST